MTQSDNPEEGQTGTGLRLPVLPLFETVVFPLATQPIQVGRQASLQAVEEAVRQASGRTEEGKRRTPRILLVTQQDATKQDVGPDDLMDIGVLAELGPMFRLPDGTVQLLALGKQRVRIVDYVRTEPFLEVEAELIESPVELSREITALMESVKELISMYGNL